MDNAPAMFTFSQCLCRATCAKMQLCNCSSDLHLCCLASHNIIVFGIIHLHQKNPGIILLLFAIWQNVHTFLSFTRAFCHGLLLLLLTSRPFRPGWPTFSKQKYVVLFFLHVQSTTKIKPTSCAAPSPIVAAAHTLSKRAVFR